MNKSENQMNFSSGSGISLNLYIYCKKEKNLKNKQRKLI